MPRAFVEIHPEDAREMGVSDGNPVRIVSRRGSLVVPASVEGRSIPRRGLVFVPFFDESKMINDVTLDSYCPISREPDYKKCAVRLERVSA
jgi:nitrate reductase NapA